jgi:predicted secreted hydrolase
MKRFVLCGLALLSIAAMLFACVPSQSIAPQSDLVGIPGSASGFQKADGPRSFSFPADHGPHPNFQTEWWYYTGNLESSSGRHFGFELTFFRRAIIPPDQLVPRQSDWATDQLYLAHFALTDVSGKQFYYYEHAERGAVGLAGASAEPLFSVWLDNWSVKQTAGDQYQLSASQGNLALDLQLHDLKGPILQGDKGLSQKGAGSGNASYYYSLTRLETTGKVSLSGVETDVQGLSWMDHEFSTSALAPDEVGWDWFALQLSDGSELMVYDLRRQDGSIDPYSSGTLVRPDGSSRYLTRQDFQIKVTSTWRSPHSGAVYPAGWVVSLPSEQLSLTIKPYLADQELNVSFIYWEGAVQISGQAGGKPVTGSGYVELTGYARSMQGQF